MNQINIRETSLEFGEMLPQPYVNRIVIHHIGDPPRDVSASEVHGWHLGNGWAGIGYHYLIRREGTIERGRPEEYIGSHAQGFNTGSIGINFAGNMEIMPVTPEQIESGAMLMADICLRYGMVPDGVSVVGHGSLMPTSCPGKNLRDLLDILRGKAVWYTQN
jgi:hypothetical protein